jgi:hypothetical protein
MTLDPGIRIFLFCNRKHQSIEATVAESVKIRPLARKSLQSFQASTYDVASVKARRIINCNFAGLVLYPKAPSAGPAHEAVAVSSG